MNFDKIIEKIPDYKTFLTVDELDASTLQLEKEYPDVVSVFEAGKSRKGHSILCSKVGNGSKNALFFAFPHPNEPIGAMTIEFLERELVENKELRERMDYTWYFMKCVDPDGTKLNEDWFKGPFNIYNYSRNFFRPGSIEQVEWTFPISYKNLTFDTPMPETQAIMNVIEQVKPEFMYSLHNAGFGGAYWYISHPYADIYDDLRKSAEKQGVALHLGEPESPSAVEYSQSIYKMLGIEEEYDFIEKYTDAAPEEEIDCGSSSASYAEQFNDCVTLLTELPYFFDERIQDLSPSTMTRREAVHESVNISNEMFGKMDAFLENIRPYISNDNPFPLLVEQMIHSMGAQSEAKKKWAEQDEFSEMATVSEEFDNLFVSRFYHGLCVGMVARCARFEIDRIQAQGLKKDKIVEQLLAVEEQAVQLLKENSEYLEKHMDYEVIPIQTLVKIQVECGLLVAKHRAEQE